MVPLSSVRGTLGPWDSLVPDRMIGSMEARKMRARSSMGRLVKRGKVGGLYSSRNQCLRSSSLAEGGCCAWPGMEYEIIGCGPGPAHVHVCNPSLALASSGFEILPVSWVRRLGHASL